MSLTPPADFSGTVSLDVSITTKDGDAAPLVTTLPHQITIAPVSDAVIIPPASSAGFEDAPLAFGSNIIWSETEVPGDRSEIVTRVAIGAPPAGFSITPGAAPGAIITPDGSGGFTITSSLAGQAGEDAIRAALDGFTITRPCMATGRRALPSPST